MEGKRTCKETAAGLRVRATARQVLETAQLQLQVSAAHSRKNVGDYSWDRPRAAGSLALSSGRHLAGPAPVRFVCLSQGGEWAQLALPCRGGQCSSLASHLFVVLFCLFLTPAAGCG